MKPILGARVKDKNFEIEGSVIGYTAERHPGGKRIITVEWDNGHIEKMDMDNDSYSVIEWD